MASVFETLSNINVNGHTEKKTAGKDRNGRPIELTYLSWPWAWAEVKKLYPDARYTVVKDQNGLPYFADPRTGIMVYTTVTIDGVTHEMWLPVMDGANYAMRFEPYEVQTKYGGVKSVAAATMMEINKAVMRCLTKNLAMFGLGLYIYAGEDLPEGETAQEKPEEKKAPVCERCGKTVTEVQGKSGEMMTAEQVLVIGRKFYGGEFCAECQKELEKKRKAEKAAQDGKSS